MVRGNLFFCLTMAGCATAATTADVRRMSDRGDTEALMKTWEETDRDSVRIAVIEGLAAHEAERALVLRQAASAPSSQVRLAAVRGLGSYDGAEVVPALVNALADPFPAIREVAKSALAKRGPAANDALLEALEQNPSHLVRAAAAKLLARSAKGPDKQLRLRVSLALLDAAKRDDAPKVRESAVVGLGALGEPKARPVLTELMRTDGDSGVRMAAERALARIGDGGGAPVVVAVLPFKVSAGTSDAELGLLGRQIADFLAARVSAAEVAQVVDREKMERALKEMEKLGVHLYDGDALNAPEMGRFKMANQLVYGSVQKQGQVFTIVANRMDVSTLELIPGASVTVSGYRADLEQLKSELTERFIRNFR